MDELSWVLEKKEQDKLTLLNYLATQSDSFLPIKRIMTSLGWSRYRTLSTIAMLFDDLVTYFPNEPTAYRYDDKQKAVIVDRMVLVDVKTVAFDYRQKSVVWQLLGSYSRERLIPMNSLLKRITRVCQLRGLPKVKLRRP